MLKRRYWSPFWAQTSDGFNLALPFSTHPAPQGMAGSLLSDLAEPPLQLPDLALGKT